MIDRSPALARCLLPLSLALAAACKSPPRTDGAASQPADGAASQQGGLASAPGRLASQQGNGATSPAPAGDKVTLLFAASTAGQLVPCGCSPDQKGGLPRGVALVKKIRAEGGSVVYVDAGDLLFDAPPAPVAVEQAEAKARVLARGDELLSAAARAVGQRDLLRGPAFAAQLAGSVPLLDAGGAPVASARQQLVVKAGQVPVGLFAAGLSDSEKSLAARAQQLRAGGARLVVLLYHPPKGELSAWTRAQALQPAARAAGVDLVVLGHRDDPASDLDQADAGPPALLAVEGHGQSILRVDVTLPTAPSAGAPLFLSRGEAGRKAEVQRFDERIARLREQAASAPEERKPLYLGKVAEQEKLRAAALGAVESVPAGAALATATFLPLDGKAGEDAEAKALVAAYDDQIAQANLAAAKLQPERCPAPDAGEAAFVGISAPVTQDKESCATCHKTEAQFWLKTGHSHAYATLEKVKKQFSLDCIRCHVTGWQQPGGVCRIDRTAFGGPGLAVPRAASQGADATTGGGASVPAQGTQAAVHAPSEPERAGLGRRDVQCEACHGAASEHVKDPPGHIVAKVEKTTCLRCHEAANSPHFDFAKYRPWVVGPGHGAVLARGQEPGPTGK